MVKTVSSTNLSELIYNVELEIEQEIESKRAELPDHLLIVFDPATYKTTQVLEFTALALP
jgi:hypothetical protein